MLVRSAPLKYAANNIVTGNGDAGIRSSGLTGTGNTAIRNDVWNNHNDGAFQTGITFVNQLSVDPEYVSSTDFHLRPTSPLIGEADLGYSVADDKDGVLRDSTPDIGAYESTASFRSASSAQVAASTAITYPRPAGVLAGDVLVAQVVHRGSAAITAPSGWVSIRDTFLGTGTHMQSWYRVAVASEPSSYPFTSSQANGKAGGVSAWAGVDSTDPVEAHSGNTGTGASMTATGVTATGGNTPILWLGGYINATTITPPLDFTERWDVAATGSYKATAETSDQIQLEAGPTGNKVGTSATSGGAGWITQLIALRPAG